MRRFKADLITYHQDTGVWAIYLIDEEAWSADADEHLRAIQSRVYDALDAILDGHVAAKYPASLGRRFRVQVDLYGDAPASVERLAAGFNELLASDHEYAIALRGSSYVDGLEVQVNRRK